jgi:alpha-glucosidase
MKLPRRDFIEALGVSVLGGIAAPGSDAALQPANSEPLTVSSPDGNITVTFALKSNPQPYYAGERAYYQVLYQGKVVLADSPLGLDFKGATALDRDFEIVNTSRESLDSHWLFEFGARRDIPDHYNQLTVMLRERSGPKRRLDLIFRAYNEGMAFRYVLPAQDSIAQFTLAAENSGFYFPSEVFAFALNLGSYATAYEASYEHGSLNEIKPSSIIGLPLLIQMPQGPWVALLEADLTNYAGMYVGGVPGVSNALTTKLSPMPGWDPAAMGTYTEVVRTEHDLGSTWQLALEKMLLKRTGESAGSEDVVQGTTPMTTPWRVLLIATRPGDLIESNYIVLNLSSTLKLKDTSWIKPGKAAWDWWSGSMARDVDFKPGMNTATMKHYVDFAADHHLEYMLIDGNWSPFNDITRSIPEIDMPEILAHAKEKGVKVLLWMLWTAALKQADTAFPLYQQWGVAGVKVDFMDRDDQEMVKFYEEIVRKAAEHKLVIDLHGAFKPTGLRRAYPNLLVREGLMGMEQCKSNYRVNPEYDVIIPFTRMLAGPMDYTPGSFHNATREQFKPRFVEPSSQGTRAHQLAMYVVYEMPLAMVSDFPEAYQGQPEFEFIERVPTVWDDTKVLNGEPAQYVTVARRRERTWYLGSMTNWEARDIRLSLDFLPAGAYEAKIFADGADADKVASSVAISKRMAERGTQMGFHLAPGGGLAIILTPST